MFRRVSGRTGSMAVAVTQCRAVGQYKFGHPSLDEEFKGTNKLSYKPVSDKGVKITTVSNGTRIISHDMEGALVSVGAYIHAGPKYDPVTAPGLSYVMRFALTTSNYENSLFQIDRTIRATGVAFQHLEMRKEYIGLRLDGRQDMWKPTAANMFTAIAAPRFHESDIERFRDTMDNLLKEQRWQAPREYAIGQLETISFYKEPLGNPRMVPEVANDLCSQTTLLDQYSRYVVPSNVIIAGVNVDHSELIAEYENAPFNHSQSAPHHQRAAEEGKAITANNNAEQAQYYGGEYHEQESRAKEMGTKPDMDSETIAAFGFLTFGRDGTLKDYASTLVVQQLMNIAYGDAIRYTRDGTTQGVRSFYNPFTTAGLLGFTVVADPSSAVKVTSDATKVLQTLKVDEGNLAAAKMSAVTSFASDHVDSVRSYCDFLGTSVARSGTQYLKVQEVLDAVRGVSATDVMRVKDLALSKKPSIYVHGETLAFPSLRQFGF